MEFEAETLQCVGVVLSMRVEGVVQLFLASLRCKRRTSTCYVSFRGGASSPASTSTGKQTRETKHTFYRRGSTIFYKVSASNNNYSFRITNHSTTTTTTLRSHLGSSHFGSSPWPPSTGAQLLQDSSCPYSMSGGCWFRHVDALPCGDDAATSKLNQQVVLSALLQRLSSLLKQIAEGVQRSCGHSCAADLEFVESI